MSNTDFSICEDCLGGQTRLTRSFNGAECKICTLPFTVYHFKANSKVNRTLICHNCSKQRNVCQCCMLDLQWHIPVELRDRILSTVQGSQVATQEAQNEMMKRFIALKNGDTYKVGGASVTSDSVATADAVESIRKTVGRLQKSQENRDSAKARVTPASVSTADVSHLTKKLPLKGTLSSAQSFFIYNLDPSIPEWAIVDAVSELVGTVAWQDPTSTSVTINHMARCGGIRFKSVEIAEKFRLGLQSFVTPAKTTKGKLQVQNSKLHIVAWPQYHRAALGIKNAECSKLAQILDKQVQSDLATADVAKSAPKPAKIRKSSKASESKKSKRTKRIMDIEL
ncbi:LAME_0E02850g1_1 [Lachancea meyersii CBS 8951]|uniref:Pre-mRNA-splicing factor SLT11 n=1 Tax=Lachancea meyersii CBS 8951 TaxID=1266667 RepID=A0A1G4JG28_9SACH|nr:LAME_0E02850g1_1 [Lachancea meyersii CBS 8951]